MNIVLKGASVLVSLAVVYGVHCSSSKPKKVTVKIVKTDAESRGKTWSYRILQDTPEATSLNTPYKSIKKDRTISYTTGPEVMLEICTGPSGKGRCQQQQLDGISTLLAIDKEGNASVQTTDGIQRLIAESKP